MDGLLSNPSPGTRSSNAVGSHIEERTFASLCHRQRQRRRKTWETRRFRRSTQRADEGINDHSGAITRARRRRRRSRRSLVSNHPRRGKHTSVFVASYKRSFRLDFKGETRDVDGWRATDRVTTKRAKPYGNVSQIKPRGERVEIRRDGEKPSVSAAPVPLYTSPRGAREWKKIGLLLLESRDPQPVLSSVASGDFGHSSLCGRGRFNPHLLHSLHFVRRT